ncbi:hypothetical protein F5B17DRAFT_432224 [Nemania serpens]|nr:hypothetical protein F5B17DRAFT_432224 [Nemania serpens]
MAGHKETHRSHKHRRHSSSSKHAKAQQPSTSATGAGKGSTSPETKFPRSAEDRKLEMLPVQNPGFWQGDRVIDEERAHNVRKEESKRALGGKGEGEGEGGSPRTHGGGGHHPPQDRSRHRHYRSTNQRSPRQYYRERERHPESGEHGHERSRQKHASKSVQDDGCCAIL